MALQPITPPAPTGAPITTNQPIEETMKTITIRQSIEVLLLTKEKSEYLDSVYRYLYASYLCGYAQYWCDEEDVLLAITHYLKLD